MKTIILMIRHAKSIANETGIFGGITDYELCKEGFKQAEALAKRLKEFEIDKIYSSPLKRAVQTITPTAVLKNLDINIVDGLKEMYVGTWENILRDDLRKKYPDENKYIDETEHFTGMEGQEETIDVANRMYESILKIAKENTNKTVVITSHFVAMKAFLCKIMSIPFKETKKRIDYLGNASITKIVYDDNLKNFTVEYIGR